MELFRLIRSRPSQSPDKRGIMGNSFQPGRSGLFGQNSPIESTRCSIYFPAGAGGGGVTTSLCWVQAPSPKAVSRTAMIMIFFRNFNLSRLLSSQVAPVRLGGEPSRSNAFLHFFELTQMPDRFILGSRWYLRRWSLLPSFVLHCDSGITDF